MSNQTAPIITVLDIELLPIEAQVWQLFDQNVGLNQIQQDWTLMSFAAKRLDPMAPTVPLRKRRHRPRTWTCRTRPVCAMTASWWRRCGRSCMSPT
jgi:hypothetical protein